MKDYDGRYYVVGKEAFELVNVLRSVDPQDTIEKWDEIPEERRQSMYKFIDEVLKNPDMTAKDMHDEWMTERFRTGWNYGHITDRDNKIHSCLVPYDELNELQKAKDAIVIHVVNKNRIYFQKKG